MINISTNLNKTNNQFSLQIKEHTKRSRQMVLGIEALV
jgi:hypothetical protein